MPRLDADKRAELKQDLATVYTPSAPIVDPDLFSGRQELLAQLSDKLGEPGTHFVLYGEHGVGKTSLWQVLLANRRLRRHSASGSDDFLSIFLPVLEELGEQFTAEERQRMVSAGFSAGSSKVASVKAEESTGSTEAAIEKRKVDLNLVLERVGNHANKIDAIVIDEFHNITSPVVQGQLIELAKGLSDQRIEVQLFLVGVADDDDDLIRNPEYRKSKSRHFSISRIPRMSDSELQEILDLRRHRFSVELEAGVRDAIVQIASGYPFVAHRLALVAAQNWVMRAFTGYALGFLASVISLVSGVGVSGFAAVKKAGVFVEHQDLRAAAARFIAVFDANHTTAANGYREMRTSQSAESFELILNALASSPLAEVDVAGFAQQLSMTPDQLETLVGDGFDLVERTDSGYALSVLELRPYLQATRYLDTRSGT